MKGIMMDYTKLKIENREKIKQNYRPDAENNDIP